MPVPFVLAGAVSIYVRRRSQDGNSCSQVRSGVVKKLHDERVLIEHVLNDAPLNAATAAVDQAHLRESGSMRLDDVLFND